MQKRQGETDSLKLLGGLPRNHNDKVEIPLARERLYLASRVRTNTGDASYSIPALVY